MWSFGVHAGNAVSEGTQFDPASWFEWMVDLVDDPEPVPGLGDAAVYGRGLLYVRGEGRAFTCSSTLPDDSPAKLWATAIAIRVLERLATGEAG